MKNKTIISVLVLLVLLLSIAYVNAKYHYKENHLYTEQSLYAEQVKKDTESVTRRMAMRKAYDIFENVYQINLESNEIQMYINLYKDKKECETYQWVMSWYDYNKNETYVLTMDANSGEILYLFCGIRTDNVLNVEPESLSYQEIRNMIALFAEKTGISMESLELKISSPVKTEEKSYWFQTCKLLKKDTQEVIAILMIDSTNFLIREYELQHQ